MSIYDNVHHSTQTRARRHITHTRIGTVITAIILSWNRSESSENSSPERPNGVLLLDALSSGEDIPKGGSDIPECSLAVSLRLRLGGPGNNQEEI